MNILEKTLVLAGLPRLSNETPARKVFFRTVSPLKIRTIICPFWMYVPISTPPSYRELSRDRKTAEQQVS